MKTELEIPEGFRRHENGGGLVALSATVEASVFVGENARVYGTAQVYGDAWETSPLYVQGSKHAATNCKFGHIAIGCEVHTFAEWKANFKVIGKNNGYTDEQIAEYRVIIALFSKIGR